MSGRHVGAIEDRVQAPKQYTMSIHDALNLIDEAQLVARRQQMASRDGEHACSRGLDRGGAVC